MKLPGAGSADQSSGGDQAAQLKAIFEEATAKAIEQRAIEVKGQADLNMAKAKPNQ